MRGSARSPRPTLATRSRSRPRARRNRPAGRRHAPRSTTCRGRNAPSRRLALASAPGPAKAGACSCTRSTPIATREQRVPARRAQARLRSPPSSRAADPSRSDRATPRVSSRCASLRSGPEHGDRHFVAVRGQSTRQLQRVPPHPAHRVGRHEHYDARRIATRPHARHSDFQFRQGGSGARPGCR